MIPNTEELFQPLKDAIRTHSIPALTGMAVPSDLERDLFALPYHLGGIGVANPIKDSNSKSPQTKSLNLSLT